MEENNKISIKNLHIKQKISNFALALRQNCLSVALDCLMV